MSMQSTWKAWLQLGKTRAFSSFSNSDKQTAQVSGYVRVNKGGDCFIDRKVQTFGSSSSGGWRGNGGGNGEQVLSTTPAEVAATAVPEEERSVVMEAEEDEQD
uniref:Uncharacterized protein n=1 Tax=Gossypium raimondii TaxID=29730 RepID=A0A0D2SWZ2_GOSRA|nr:hypothetical protein B456_010G217800 [Gossypium raimondii]